MCSKSIHGKFISIIFLKSVVLYFMFFFYCVKKENIKRVVQIKNKYLARTKKKLVRNNTKLKYRL